MSTGQYVRLADGRSAMLYVSIPARAISDQLAGLTAEGGPIFSLVDPSQRMVARSVGIDQVMFAAAPDWLLPFLGAGTAGTALGVPGPVVVGGTRDAGYHPLTAPRWMAAAVQPTPLGARLWAPVSFPSALTLVGLLLSGLLFWVMVDRDRAAMPGGGGGAPEPGEVTPPRFFRP